MGFILIRVPQTIRIIALSKYTSIKKPNQHVIVIVTNYVHIRAFKLAYGLKISNYKVVLLHSGAEYHNFDPSVSNLFDEVLRYNSADDALVKAIHYKPLAYHIICNWDYTVAKTFIKMRPGVVVVDTLDVLGGFVRPKILDPVQEKAEQFCFENADGICCRDLRTQYLKQKMGYQLVPRLFWPDYCWPAGFTNTEEKNSGKHVVYAGNLEINPASAVAYQYELARILTQASINFHIFPSHVSHKVELENEMRNFVSPDLMKYLHVHDTIPFLELSREISRFHAGILISTNDINYGDGHDTYRESMGDYFLAAKLFDYYEAGLLSLTQKMRLANHIFPKNGSVREVGSLNEIAEIVSNTEIRDTKVEPKLRLDFHAHRLPAFYLRLYKKRNKHALS